MRMTFVVRSITAITNDRLLVQLAGGSGNIQLNLPISEQARLRVGLEFILSDLDEGTPSSPSFSSTDRPLGGRRIDLED